MNSCTRLNTNLFSHHAQTLTLGGKLFLAPLKNDVQVNRTHF